MARDVIITIQSKQSFQGNDEVTELVTEGTLERMGEDAFVLRYEESALTGMEGTSTTFRVEPGQITLTRQGEYNSQMIFRQGERDLSMYNTPYGGLTIGVSTHRMTAQLSDHGGSIEVAYAIEAQYTLVGENFFHIQVREKGTPGPEGEGERASCQI